MATAAFTAPRWRLVGAARRTVGLALLLMVVVTWTGSNFLGSVRILFAFYAVLVADETQNADSKVL